MPRHVEAMLATPFPRSFDHPDWIFEVKWDGYRAIAEVEQGSVRLYSRRGLSLMERFRLIANSLAQLGHDAVLDGEVVVLDESGKAQFQLLQNRGRSGEGVLAYYVFDLLYLDGHDLRGLALVRRKELLARVVAGLPHVRLSEHIREQGTAFFAAAEKQGLEGIVAKLAESRYEAGQRSRAWPPGDDSEVGTSWLNLLQTASMADWACRAALNMIRAILDMIPDRPGDTAWVFKHDYRNRTDAWIATSSWKGVA
jgi:bifunctional non-homologous end joining protein LigD